ncbi:MAG TPA: NAD(P)/FAD-dependent oxidoreductase, partial [Solirubrobacterales bacterium]|nr:NAD(P)/FAD-dependent oxidoreductase [Solirubrobacterales bacterium]
GVGCGWAFQSAEWLRESVEPALQGDESLEQGLERYRRRHAQELKGHSFFIHDYSTGRRFNPAERLLFSAATRDPKTASILERFATRQIKPQQMLPRAVPRALAVNARHALKRPRARVAALSPSPSDT